MNKTVLLIDDDDALRDTLAKGLRKESFYVITASSGEQARVILEKISPNAIILDRMMGGIDGLSLLKELRNKGNKIPVIMLTAMTGAENTIDGLSSGADDYLAKPFQLRELVLRLDKVIKLGKVFDTRLPSGLLLIDKEFFVKSSDNAPSAILNLSIEEKKLLTKLVTPIGNIVSVAPMTAKRLREKINGVLLSADIITVRGRGYKIIETSGTI